MTNIYEMSTEDELDVSEFVVSYVECDLLHSGVLVVALLEQTESDGLSLDLRVRKVEEHPSSL